MGPSNIGTKSLAFWAFFLNILSTFKRDNRLGLRDVSPQWICSFRARSGRMPIRQATVKNHVEQY